MAQRRQNFQNISWFWDLRQQARLDMDPRYQRRSVWTQKFRQNFIDTILLDYPAPAIFLFARIDDSGRSFYELVDGKQRLTAVYDFLEGALQVADDSPFEQYRGKSFKDLSPDMRLKVYEYNFSVEYLPTNNEDVINNIFDRLNRNVARLTPQELRHARFGGLFITTAERLAEWLTLDLDANFPRIPGASRTQMKDVEFIATLLLLLEEGPKSYSALSLDSAFSERDEHWDAGALIEDRFRTVIQFLRKLRDTPEGSFLPQSRYRNQADYYSLFGATSGILTPGTELPLSDAAARLKAFHDAVEDPDVRVQTSIAQAYYDATRSASSDPGPRATRIRIMKHILLGGDIAVHPESIPQ